MGSNIAEPNSQSAEREKNADIARKHGEERVIDQTVGRAAKHQPVRYPPAS